jgi:signal transduction histidine kinase
VNERDALVRALEHVSALERQLVRERSARRQAETIAEEGLRRLWEANRRLDERVGRRTAELAAARQRALDAARAKTEFIANLSHEVGTPLQTILLAVEMADVEDPVDRARLARAARATQELHQLFSNLLELALCETGDIEAHPRPTSMVEVSDALVRRWADRLSAVGLLLSPEAWGAAEVDPERLVQLGDLLLDNVLRFARPGLVHLELVADERRVVLSVADGGPGVAEPDLERIMEPFVQAEGGAARPTAGAGIGLALARGIAQRLGGSAAAAPNDRGGLTVTVELAVSASGAETVDAGGPTTAAVPTATATGGSA